MSDRGRFAIRFDAWYRALSSALLLPPSASYVEYRGDEVCVKMGWAFRVTFPPSAVASVSQLKRRPVSRGVHGAAGRWLVNGSGEGILAIDFEPVQRAYVLGIPVRLRQLLVSVEEPDGLKRCLTEIRSLP
jgi:hypothetical protein